MKRILLVAAVVLPLPFVINNGCVADETTSPTTGTGSGGSGQTTTGDTTTSSGDTTSTTGSGTAGASSTTSGPGGMAGSTSSSGSGGSAGSGAGGASGGSGGMAGTAGASAGGSGGTGGAAGAGMGGSGGGMCGIDCLAGSTKSNFGFYWKDSWFITGCYQKQGADCWALPNTCPGTPMGGGFEDSGSVARETFPLGGTMGTTYLVTFTLNGITEAKVHQGGMFANPNMDVATPMAGDPVISEGGVNNNTFYIGGSAVPSTYNVMRLRVLNSAKTEVQRYYMNAFPANGGWESHRTFTISYTHTIEVPGGGFIEYTTEDSNCRAIDNCGVGAAVTNGDCSASRYIPNEMNVPLPATYGFLPGSTTPRTLASMNVVNAAVQPWHSQLNHFTITKVVAK
jgi:hypothetical protein